MTDAEWSFVLLSLRVAVCVALYLFLLAAFRALRAELRRPTVPVEEARSAPVKRASPTRVAAPMARAAAAQTSVATLEVPQSEPIPAQAAEAPVIERTLVRRTTRRPRSTGSPLARAPLRNAFIILAPLLILGGAAVIAANARPNEQADAPAPAKAAEVPTSAAPAPGRVAVGLRPQEDSGLRVTVDNVVQFNGVLRAGQHQRWEGNGRIQVWTDKGKTLLLSVNGHDLGPYSPAMGHPEWNRIDFAFAPGWRP